MIMDKDFVCLKNQYLLILVTASLMLFNCSLDPNSLSKSTAKKEALNYAQQYHGFDKYCDVEDTNRLNKTTWIITVSGMKNDPVKYAEGYLRRSLQGKDNISSVAGALWDSAYESTIKLKVVKNSGGRIDVSKISGLPSSSSPVLSSDSWSSPTQALAVLAHNNFVTSKEVEIMKEFDNYIADPRNSDSDDAVKKWCRKRQIAVERLKEIDAMRYGYGSIAELLKNGYVELGKKKIKRQIGKPMGTKIKVFDVSYSKDDNYITIHVKTDLPDDSPLMFSIDKSGLRPDDTWIGNQAKARVYSGEAEVRIPLRTHQGYSLPSGNYDIEIMFNSFWSSRQKGIDYQVQAAVGEYGENLDTKFNGEFNRSGEIFRTIEYEKQAAFSL